MNRWFVWGYDTVTNYTCGLWLKAVTMMEAVDMCRVIWNTVEVMGVGSTVPDEYVEALRHEGYIKRRMQ